MPTIAANKGLAGQGFGRKFQRNGIGGNSARRRYRPARRRRRCDGRGLKAGDLHNCVERGPKQLLGPGSFAGQVQQVRYDIGRGHTVTLRWG